MVYFGLAFEILRFSNSVVAGITYVVSPGNSAILDAANFPRKHILM